MAVREIRLYGDPVLREKAAPVDEVDDVVRQLAADMLDTLEEAEGVGLAGPQVGETHRIIVIHPPPEIIDEVRPDPRVVVNPVVVEKSGPVEDAEEGCLSIPGIYESVKRSRHVMVKGTDLDGNAIEIESEGITGRILLHEIDHLDGVLFIDRIGPMRRALLKKKLRAFFE